MGGREASTRAGALSISPRAPLPGANPPRRSRRAGRPERHFSGRSGRDAHRSCSTASTPSRPGEAGRITGHIVSFSGQPPAWPFSALQHGGPCAARLWLVISAFGLARIHAPGAHAGARRGLSAAAGDSPATRAVGPPADGAERTLRKSPLHHVQMSPTTPPSPSASATRRRPRRRPRPACRSRRAPR